MDNREVSIGDWILTMILTSIPVVNIIMLCIWAFGGENTPASKRNWAKATLIVAAIAIVLSLILVFFSATLFISLL